MQINISTRHGNLSETTREKVITKLEKLSRIYERLHVVNVTIDLEHRETPSIDVTISAERKHDFVASCHAEELMTGVDTVLHKLEQQLRKHKEKLQSRHRGPGHQQQVVRDDSE